jgi:nucleotidyltransferase substrate binding protein (TIGR01987 family)
MSQDIRWKQRFNNFEAAFLFLQEAVEKDKYSQLEIAGLVQAFEFTFELAWKTIKDYIEALGITANSPREAIKESFSNGIIEDGKTWLTMLEKRNELSHTYNKDVAENAVDVIRFKYYIAISQVYEYLKERIK